MFRWKIVCTYQFIIQIYWNEFIQIFSQNSIDISWKIVWCIHQIKNNLSIIQTIHIFYVKSLIIHHFQLYKIYEKQWLCSISYIILFFKCCSMFHQSTTINNNFCVWIYSMHDNSCKITVFHQTFKQIIRMKWSMNYWFWFIFCSNNDSEFFVISIIYCETYYTMIFIIFVKFYHLFFSIK